MKKLLIPVLLLGLVFVLYKSWDTLSTFIQRPQNKEANPEYTFKAKIEYLTGTVYKLQGNDRLLLLEGDELSESDHVVTQQNARIVLNIDDGSVIRIGSNTELVLSELKPKSMLISQSSGELFARVNKDANHKFIVKAKDIDVESKGTAFSVEVNDDVTVKVYESKVVIKKMNNNTEVAENNEWEGKTNKVETINKQEIANNQFLNWSVKEEVKTYKLDEVAQEIKEEPKAEEPKKEEEVKEEPKPNTNASITLLGSSVETGIYLSWKVENLTADHGYKIVKSEWETPKFPGDMYVYFEDSSVRSYTWDLKDGKKWHFRVCEYNGDGSCGLYSNEITVTAPQGEEEHAEESSDEVKSISLKASKKSDDTVKLEWSVVGKSDKGFKVVWSKDEHPVYPSRKHDYYHYYDDEDKRSDVVENLDSDKYYFRVCEYLGGKCGKYSNEVSVNLD